MANDHDPSTPDAAAPAPSGGVPRHASAKERRGLGPFLSDLKAEVQNQLARAEIPGRVPGSGAGRAVVTTTATAEVTTAEGATGHGSGFAGSAAVGPDRTTESLTAALPEPFGRSAEDAAALATAALATADHAGAEAVAARQEADAARADAAAARS
ncbi:hypothetical protein ACFV9F_27025, partial [Promicromonospora sukumoe]